MRAPPSIAAVLAVSLTLLVLLMVAAISLTGCSNSSPTPTAAVAPDRAQSVPSPASAPAKAAPASTDPVTEHADGTGHTIQPTAPEAGPGKSGTAATTVTTTPGGADAISVHCADLAPHDQHGPCTCTEDAKGLHLSCSKAEPSKG